MAEQRARNLPQDRPHAVGRLPLRHRPGAPSKPTAPSSPVAGRIAKALAVAVLAGLWLTAPALAQEQATSGEKVVVSAHRDDMQFLAGRSITVSADVRDDVVAAGQDVTLDNASVGTAIIAGYDVEQKGGSASDMIAAAANLSVGGRIADDIIAAARLLRIREGAEIAGDARLAAETIEVDGRIDGSLRSAARKVVLNGTIGGKVDLIAERIVIGPTAQIHGNVVYRSPEPPEIAEGAVIDGEIHRKELDLPDLRKIGFALIGIGLVLALSWLTSVVVMLALLHLAFPANGMGAATRLIERPLASLGLGVALSVAAVALAGILIVSILGLPAGLALLVALALAKLFALGAAGLAIGLLLRRALRGSGTPGVASQIGWLIAGLFCLTLVFFIPVAGGILVALAVIAGLGGVIAELWSRLRAGSESAP